VLNSLNVSFNNYRTCEVEDDSIAEKTVLKGFNNLSKLNNANSEENISPSAQMICSLN
jgi:hypothetical protein